MSKLSLEPMLVKAILPFSPGTRSRWSQQRQPSNQHSNKDYLAGSRAECPHRGPFASARRPAGRVIVPVSSGPLLLPPRVTSAMDPKPPSTCAHHPLCPGNVDRPVDVLSATQIGPSRTPWQADHTSANPPARSGPFDRSGGRRSRVRVTDGEVARRRVRMDDAHTRRVHSWIDNYIHAWNSNDPADIRALFTQDAAYYTEPYSQPWRGRDEIVHQWLDRKDEPGQTQFRWHPLAVTPGGRGCPG
jgi:SnoaL-like domain